MKIKYLSIIFLLSVPFVIADSISPEELFTNSLMLLPILLLAVYCLNFLINYFIVLFCIKHYENPPTKETLEWKKIALMTLIGSVIDVIAWLIFSIFSLILYSLFDNILFYIIESLMLFLMVGIPVAITSYYLIFNKYLPEKQAKRSAIIFGIISNPVWFNLIISSTFYILRYFMP